MNDTAKVIGAIVLIGLGVFFFRSGSAKIEQSQDFPDGTHWICLGCKAEFAKSLDEVADWNSANPEKSIPCPKCSESRSVRASKCPLPECGRHFTGSMVEINGEVCCPICKKPVP